MNTLPIAVIGAGPIGMAAAAHLISQGETPLVLEAGDSVGANVMKWGHVRVFSPWSYCIDNAARNLLEAAGWQAPNPDHLPTGAELVNDYLQPLANLTQIKPHLRLQTRVLSITRYGYDKLSTRGRDEAPFLLHVQNPDGSESHLLAKAVMDASGTYAKPNPLGASGVPAMGETALADSIFYGIPDIQGSHRARYAGKRVMVVGSGHSAFNALLDLGVLSQTYPETKITWVVRRANLNQLYGGGESDELPARGSLGLRLHQLVDAGALKLVSGFKVTRLTDTDAGIIVSSVDQDLDPVDEIIATTGLRPDLSLSSELRLELDASLESPVALAPVIDPNVHSCGTVPPHGAVELLHPEKNFFVVGMKSYGRAPNFLMLTGYEQVRSVVAALTGDWESARQVQLLLPETGVCSTDQGGDSCCGTASASIPVIDLISINVR